MKIKVNVKSIGAGHSSVEAQDLEISDLQFQTTVGAFLDAITKECVSNYKKRQQENEILKVLTNEIIEDKSAAGKVAFGINYGRKSPDLKKALENTRQCYLDGIFALFIDGKEFSGLNNSFPLDTPLEIHENSNATFIRLTMLAGRMW